MAEYCLQELPETRFSSNFDLSNEELAALRAEVDEYFSLMKRFHEMEPDEIFMKLSSITARAAEIRIALVRRESRRCTALRTKEIDPLIEQVDRQFRMWSRILAVKEIDVRLSGGQV